MTTVYIKTESWTEVTRESTGEDYCGEDTSTSWDFCGLSMRNGNGYYESFETDFDVKAGDLVFPVYVVYSSGDSFSRRDGYRFEMMEIFKTAEEAYEFERFLNFVNGEDYSVEYKGKKYHIPWFGYFESLDYVSVETCIISA